MPLYDLPRGGLGVDVSGARLVGAGGRFGVPLGVCDPLTDGGLTGREGFLGGVTSTGLAGA
jgi:hypothetical protein